MYENIKLKEHDRGDGFKVQSTITPFFAPFLEKLALKYPQWTFEEESHNYTWDNVSGKSVKSNITATCFKVLDKREELGQVYYERVYSNNEYRFCVDNFRVQKMRERGNGMKTIHEKKALKHVDKYFGKKNLDEKLVEASNNAKQAIYHVGNDVSNKFSWGWNSFSELAQEFLITKHWQEFSEFAKNYPNVNVSKVVHLDDMPERFEKAQNANAVRECVNKDNHYLVYVDNQTYAIFRKGEPTQLKTSEELPEYIRRSVGMLKLIEDKQILGGVGCRVDSTTYIVLPQN